MIARILRAVLSAEIMGWVLVLTALQVFTAGISASLGSTDTKYFFSVGFLAVLVSFLLSKRRLQGLQSAVVVVALGVIGMWILGARLTSPLLDFVEAVLHVLRQLVPAIRYQLPIDTTAVKDAWLPVAEASNALSARLQVWLRSVDQSVIVNDALVRNLIWMLIVWLITAWLGWFSARRNAIAALVPCIFLLAAVTSYSERRVETLWALVFILLLLMGIWNYKNHTTLWERTKVDYSDSIRYDLGQAVFLLSLAVGILAFVTPSLSWRQIRDFLRERNRNEVVEMLGVQQQPVTARQVPAQKPSLPRDHLLTGGYANSEKIVMLIRTGELPPVPNPMLAQDAPRYYWRSVTYDTYVGAGWITSTVFPQNAQADTPLIPGLLNGYKTLELNVEMMEPEGRLFWSGILFSADVPLRADWRTRPESSLFAEQSTLLQADLFAAVSQARAYHAQSYVPLFTIEELRVASMDYPEDIQAEYLKLPGSVPERVRQLARDITGGKTNAYDKAKAIEAYLRTYPYDLEVPMPPEDMDVVDYFLFDLKKGYCDYYASAMVVLARLSGLPARFVSGYAPGSYDSRNAKYIVRELHAHSWAEVYFPEIGWIEFEPTASQPEIERPLMEEVIAGQQSESSASQMLYRFRLETAIYWLSPLAVVLLSVLFYFTLLERWLYLRLEPTIAIEKIYRRLYRLGRPLAGERTRAETAYEFMQKLLQGLDIIKKNSRFRKSFDGAHHDTDLLTDLYQNSLFTKQNTQKRNVHDALSIWKRLRMKLLIARLHLAVNRALFPKKKSPRFLQKLTSGKLSSR